MLPFLVSIRTYLDALHPGLFNAATAVVVLTLLWAVKKLRPAWFEKLPTAWQAWPALTLAALTTALATSTAATAADTVVAVLGNAFLGLLNAGLGAIGLHRAMKESKLPYGNPKPSTGKTDPPASGLSAGGLIAIVLSVVLGVGACTHAGKFDPKVGPAVHDACTWLDSGNPLLGALCLTAEEVVSIFSHVKASRAHRKLNAPAPGTSALPVDICAAPVAPAPASSSDPIRERQ
jgi:hypothetical protein